MTSVQGGIQPFTRKPNPVTEPKRRNMALTKRVRAAIDAQVFEGLGRAAAAAKAGIAEITLYQALRKPVVLAYWNDCLQVLRTGERSRNVHRLTEIREQSSNLNAAVSAIKVLEEQADTRRDSSGQRVVTPGVVVVVNAERHQRPTSDGALIEINPSGELVEEA